MQRVVYISVYWSRIVRQLLVPECGLFGYTVFSLGYSWRGYDMGWLECPLIKLVYDDLRTDCILTGLYVCLNFCLNLEFWSNAEHYKCMLCDLQFFFVMA